MNHSWILRFVAANERQGSAYLVKKNHEYNTAGIETAARFTALPSFILSEYVIDERICRFVDDPPGRIRIKPG
jgi:hypothetical protein